MPVRDSKHLARREEGSLVAPAVAAQRAIFAAAKINHRNDESCQPGFKL
jgi:hypothetical protein